MFGIRIVHGAPLTNGRTDEVDGGAVLSVCRAEEGVSLGSESWICVLLLVQPAAAGHSIQYRDCTLVGRPVVEKEKRGGMHPPLIPLTPPSVCGPCAVVL